MNFNSSFDEQTNDAKRLERKRIDVVEQDPYWKTNFDSEQLDVIRSPLQDCAIIACPGSGKTHVCVGLVRYLLQQRYFACKNILVVMFGKDVNDNFKKRLATTNIVGMTQKYVRTIHSLAGTILSSLGKNKSSSNLDTIVAAAEAHLRKLGQEYFMKACPDYADIKVIIVDEAQDISGVQYDFIMTLRRLLLNCFIYMVGDSNQNIFQFQGGSDTFLRLHAPENRKYLVKNYRSTAEIIDFANEHLPWKDTPLMIAGSNKHGNKPYWHTHRSRFDALEKIVKEVKEHREGTIAIIGPFKINSKVGTENPHCIGLNSVLNRLTIEDISCNVCYDVSNDVLCSNNFRKRKAIKDNMVNLLTIHGSKGLEFDKVILIDFHYRTFKMIPSAANYRKFEYFWFVAMTRSKFHLSIHSIVTDCNVEKGNFPWPGMRNCNKDTYTAIHNSCWTIPELLRFKDEIPSKITWSVSELVNEMTNKGAKWDERHILAFERQINFEEIGEQQTLWTNNCNPIASLCEDYPTLIGIAAHYVVEAAYATRHEIKSHPSFVVKLLEEIDFVIELPDNYSTAVTKLYKRFGTELLNNGKLRVMDLINNYESLSSSEKEVATYISSQRELDDPVFIHVPSSNYWFNKTILKSLCSIFTTSYDASAEPVQFAVFLLALYRFQKEVNLSHLMSMCQELFSKVQPILHQLVVWVSNNDDFVSNKWKFEVDALHPCMALYSRADAIDPSGTVVEFKFTSSEFTYKHKLQTLLTYNNIYPAWLEPQKFRLINLRKATAQTYTFNIDKKVLLTEIINTSEMKLHDVCLLYDLETTGLDLLTAEAIERYFYEPTLNLIVSSGLIRPNNLPLPYAIEKLTGISTADVSAEGVDSPFTFRQEITNFLQLCEHPILIAYNGNRYDHRYLCINGIVEMEGLVRFIDPWSILRLMPGNGNGTYYSETLTDEYERIVGHPWTRENHRAQADVEMMQEMMQVAGIMNYRSLQKLAANSRTYFQCPNPFDWDKVSARNKRRRDPDEILDASSNDNL